MSFAFVGFMVNLMLSFRDGLIVVEMMVLLICRYY